MLQPNTVTEAINHSLRLTSFPSLSSTQARPLLPLNGGLLEPAAAMTNRLRAIHQLRSVVFMGAL